MRLASILLLLACTERPPSNPEPGAELSTLRASDIADAAEDAPSEPRSDPAPKPLPTPTEPRYGVSHILISHRDASHHRHDRSLDEARSLAEQLLDHLERGEDFAALARRHSDDPSRGRGGWLGTYATGTYLPEFEAAVASVPPGSIGPLAETTHGVHIVRREPVVEAEARHLLLQVGKGRSDAEALAAIRALRHRHIQGESFDSLARAHSEHQATRSEGGQLGLIGRGQLVPDLERAIFELEPGQVSQPVRTPWGWHLLLRER
ncbi:MAG: hypothetical protein EA397_13885 [Deltaproteobacteria bacterium]|nr:MAG: hypothetical protein EA397_13885 [Deltaproteobacteria bacterium]